MVKLRKETTGIDKKPSAVTITGGPDINKAAKYILWRFTLTNRARLSIYPHLTQATDTSNVSGNTRFRVLSRSD